MTKLFDLFFSQKNWASLNLAFTTFSFPTLIKPLKSVDIHSKEEKDAHKERTDSCAVPAASVVAESMLCFALVDTLLEKFGGDSMEQLFGHLNTSAKY